MQRKLKSPDLSGLANDNGPLTDAKIRRYVLEGHYGQERLEKELIGCNSGTFRAALEGHYGSKTLQLAREIRDSGLRRTIVRGPKAPRSAEDIFAELDELYEKLTVKEVKNELS